MIPVFSILLALGFPILAMREFIKAHRLRRTYLFSIGSFVFCAVAIVMELYTIKHRLLSGDIGGIEDTIDSVLSICVTLLVITTVLNLMLSLAFGNENKKQEQEMPETNDPHI